MAQLDHQLMFAEESTYGTLVTPTRTFEFNTEGIEETEGRTEGNPMRTGFAKRSDRFTPYFAGAAGPIQLDVLTKGFGLLFKHMLGQVATTGPAETVVYTHTATMADLLGKSLTAQLNRPFHPLGTNQPFTYKGTKINEWTLSNSVDGNLVLDLAVDAQQIDTATGLAAAAYPAGMEPLSWAGAVLSVGGSSFDVTEFSVKGNNNLATDRRFLRQNTDKKEPTGGRRSIEWSMSTDFDSMAQRTRVHATTRAGALAQIIATWKGPTLLGTTLYPQVVVTIPAGRFDSWKGAVADDNGIQQELSGVALYDGTNSPVTIAYQSADITA